MITFEEAAIRSERPVVTPSTQAGPRKNKIDEVSRRGADVCANAFFLLNWFKRHGEVSERFKEHAWKACVGEILPWVRIPPSPP